MSYMAEKWARQQRTGNARAKAVLLELANCFNGETGKCCPSLDHICEVTELQRHTVISAIKFLVEKGFIEKTLIKTQKGRATQYRLLGFTGSVKNDTMGSVKTDTTLREHSVKYDTMDSVNFNTTGSVKNDTRTSNKEQVNRTSNKKENKKEKAEEVFSLTPVEKTPRRQPLKKPENVSQQTWKDFNAIRKAKKAPLTETALNRIQNEATKAGIDLETALQVCCERGWQGFKAEWYLKDRQNKPAQRTLAQNSEPTPEDFTDNQISMFAWRISREKPYTVLSPGYCESYDQLQRRIESNLRHPEHFKKFIPVLRELHLI